MTVQLRALIAEDEPAACRRLRRLLKKAGVEVIAEAKDGETAVATIRRTDPDVVFLDVEMPGLDGFEVIRKVGIDAMPPVVFVTAFDSYAIDAFEVHAIDYLLKPFDEERLDEALFRLGRAGRGTERGRRNALGGLLEDVHQEQKRLGNMLESANRASTERILIKENDSVYFVSVGDIDWIEADGNYARIHTGAREHLVRRKISDLAEQLDESRFLRIHRSTIVNLDAVDQLVPWFSGGYIVRLKSGAEVKLSRGYASKLFERVGEIF